MPRAGKLTGWVLLGAIAAVAVLYGAAQAGIRSPWFRKAVERRLSRATGMEVHVGRIRPTESLNLRIGNVWALGDGVGVEARVLRVKWSFFAPRGLSRVRKVIVEDAALTVVVPDGGEVPTITGGGAQELVSHLVQGRLRDVVVPPRGGEPAGKVEASSKPHRQNGGIGHVRLVRGTFSLRDANGRERSAASGVGFDRTIAFDPDGRRVERWNVVATTLSAGGMQLTSIDWEAECTGDGPWNVVRFVSDGWSDSAPSASPDDIERATEQYRALLDSI